MALALTLEGEKELYLAMLQASERRTRPVQECPAALSYPALAFPGRVPEA